MENPKNPKNPDDYTDQISNFDTSLNQSRSYICSFCIRGFSNAQALGGHMNIHRRDRAKLRQKLMEENKDVFVENDSSQVISLNLNEQQEVEEAITCNDQDQDQDQEANYKDQSKKLGFWVQESNLDVYHDHHGKAMEVSIDGSSSSHHDQEDTEGLDLELRLGQSAMDKKKT